MGRFKVYIEYEGTRYSGWQVQKNARTVQGEIQAALAKVLKTNTFEFSGAGRTDAGVHALLQVAHLDAQTMLAPEIIRMKVNDELPEDINFIEVEKTPATFHARHDAVARSYLYQISRRRTALGKRFVWWIKDRLDERLMQETLDQFVGMKDLQSFTDDDPEEKSTKVLIDEALLTTAGDLILVRITGSHFLWKLVRRMVGVATEVGRGELDIREVPRLFSQQSDVPTRLTAPPSGLFLERVYYKGTPSLQVLAPVMHVQRF